MECDTHDIPDGAQHCIQCGAVVAPEGRTERLSVRDRALSGDGDLYVTREEYYELLSDYHTYVAICEPSSDGAPITRYFGRTLIIAEA